MFRLFFVAKGKNINDLGYSGRNTDLARRCQLFRADFGQLLRGGMDRISPWWERARHADRRPFLQARNAVTRALRVWFDEQGFVEVETGVLQVSPGNETHLHAPARYRTRLSALRASHAPGSRR